MRERKPPGSSLPRRHTVSVRDSPKKMFQWLVRRVSASGRGPFHSRRWNQCFLGLVLVCVAMLVRELFFANPSQRLMQNPSRWIKNPGSKDLVSLTRKERAKIRCPRWDGSPTSEGVMRLPKGPWAPDRKKPRAYLYAIVATTEAARSTLGHFLHYYIDVLGIPASHATMTIQSVSENNPYLKAIREDLDRAGVRRDEWIGTFSSATKAWHRESVIKAALEPDDWVVVADIDEFHQFPLGPGENIGDFLKRVDAEGANYVLSKFEDRVSEDGSLNSIRPLDTANVEATSLEAQFPLRCSMTEWTKPPAGSGFFAKFFLPRAEDKKIAARKASIRVHRSAHKVAWRSLWRWLFLQAPKPKRYSQQLVTRHYKWVNGLASYLAQRVEIYEICGMMWAYESASINAHLSQNKGKVCVNCGELACARAAPRESTRVAVITSVWDEHVDGVSITMNRVARFLHTRKDLDVLVVTPHDPSVPKPVIDYVKDIPKLSSSSAPIFALVGRHDYVLGLPLGPAQKKVLSEYDPHVYHLVSPDALGYSAQAYAKKTGRCTVCSYHTQLDRYVRFYTQKHGFLDKFKPRLIVQHLFGNFYNGCDVVAAPNEAVADKLVAKMNIPRSKIGFFPRGVNTTQYNPNRRNADWRRKVDAGPDDVVVLWAARLVKEKGADLFAASLAHFFKHAPAAETNRVRIVVVGDGPERDAMRAALPPKLTTFLLHLSGENLWQAYASSDIYFFPSHTEAFPNTLLEAQASGLAVLAPAYSVNVALVPRDAGYLVDEHAGPADFSAGLLSLITNQTARKQIAKRAVDVASARTWDAAFGELQNCYNRCLKKNRKRAEKNALPRLLRH